MDITPHPQDKGNLTTNRTPNQYYKNCALNTDLPTHTGKSIIAIPTKRTGAAQKISFKTTLQATPAQHQLTHKREHTLSYITNTHTHIHTHSQTQNTHGVGDTPIHRARKSTSTPLRAPKYQRFCQSHRAVAHSTHRSPLHANTLTCLSKHASGTSRYPLLLIRATSIFAILHAFLWAALPPDSTTPRQH